MALLKFLKKKTKKLDIPPPPPSLDIPPPPEDLQLPELPPLPGEEEEIKPEVKIEGPKAPKPLKIEPIKEHIPIKPIPKAPEIEPEEQVKPVENIPTEEVKPTKKEIFLKVDHYKNILESLNVVRKKINESEKIVERLNEIKNIKDKEFENWRVLLEDMERKFVYVDKTFFEG